MKPVWTMEDAHKHWGFEVSEKVKEGINQHPQKFSVVGAPPGLFGALVYRIIVGTDNSFNWNQQFSMSVEEDIKPLEWPSKTEGFFIYKLTRYQHFFESHFATVPINVPLLEFEKTLKSYLPFMQKDKKLLIRSHRLDCHEYLNCKVVRVIGNLKNIFSNIENFHLRECYWNIEEVINNDNVITISIEKLLNEDFNTFLEEYLRLCSFFDVSPNINNVRSFILLLLEKHKRFQLTLS